MSFLPPFFRVFRTGIDSLGIRLERLGPRGKPMRVLLSRMMLTGAVFGCGLLSAPLQGQTLLSLDGQKRLLVQEATQVVTYTSANGTATFGLAEDGAMTIGSAKVSIASVGLGTFEISVLQGGQRTSSFVQISQEGGFTGDSNWPSVAESLQAVANSPEGQLLLESHAVFPLAPGDPGVYGDQMSGLGNCVAQVLNATAAGAAMIGGCGTPACGPAYRWCCGSGASWYASSLYSVATGCRVASW